MSHIEAKLKEYRALRRRKELIESAKEKLERSKEKLVDLLVPKIFTNMESEKKDDEVVLIEENPKVIFSTEETDDTGETTSENAEQETGEVEKQESWRYFIIKWSLYSLTWLTLYMFFLQIQFGAVFFAVSVLLGIYFNTRTSPKKKGEVSAYSVFNENCVSIDGTLKAEQLQRELFYGAGTIRAL